MAANFRISAHQFKGNLHINIAGDFDGSSAYELLNYLKENGKAKKIFIDTTSLRKVAPFGISVFHKNLYSIQSKKSKLTFTGNYKNAIETNEYIWV